jgi:hypothetical protein
MAKDREPMDHTSVDTDATTSGRKPYVPPSVEEEALIENLAMSCALSKECGAQST